MLDVIKFLTDERWICIHMDYHQIITKASIN